MKGNTTIFMILGVALIGGLVWYFTKRRKVQETKSDPKTGDLKGCISAPANALGWTNEFTGTDWGGYAKAIQQYLPDYTDDQSGHLIAGFFKAIDVEPNSFYVRYFQDDLKEWMKSNTALPHWLVTKGAMRCDFNKAA